MQEGFPQKTALRQYPGSKGLRLGLRFKHGEMTITRVCVAVCPGSLRVSFLILVLPEFTHNSSGAFPFLFLPLPESIHKMGPFLS